MLSDLMPPDVALPILGVACFFAAALYASVGHGGASAYLAVMGLFEIAPAEMKPIALTLNIGVAALAMGAFARAGHFRSHLFWPLALASVPAAFVGAQMQAPDPVFKLILALALLCGAWQLLAVRPATTTQPVVPKHGFLMTLGLGLGFISGVIGIGGGIFLTPILVLCRCCPPKAAAAVSAAFIVVNSISGLGGFLATGRDIPAMAWGLLPMVLAGAWLGSQWGSLRASAPALLRTLAAVLVVAAAKFAII